MKKLKRPVIIFLAVLLLGGAVMAAESAGLLESIGRAATGNPEDAEEYIQVVPNEHGGYDYILKLEEIERGEIRVFGDYMYVYGFRYDESTAPDSSSADGWEEQESGMGWGCTVLDRSKQSYTAPLSTIDGSPVLYMDYAFAGCENLTDIPELPLGIQSARYMCKGCTALKTVCINGAGLIDENCFYGCKALRAVFIGSSVSVIRASVAAASPFADTGSSVTVSCAAASAGPGWSGNWNSGAAATEYGVDPIIWAARVA